MGEVIESVEGVMDIWLAVVTGAGGGRFEFMFKVNPC
jgi:hypothetical protein